MSSPEDNIREQALIALTKLNDIDAMTDHIIGMNITGSVLALVKSETSIVILRKVAHLLEHLFTDGSENFSNANIGEIALALCILIKQTDRDILIWTVSTISSLIENYSYCSEKMQFVIDTDILKDLVPLLSNEYVNYPVLRSILNISNISDEHISAVIAQDPLSYFHILLTNQFNKLRGDASRCLSIIIERSPSQVQAVIDFHLMQIIIANLQHEDSQVQYFSAQIIANIANKGTDDQIKELFCSDAIIERLFGKLQHCEWCAKLVSNEFLLI